MRRTLASVPLLALVMLVLAGCGGPPPTPGDATPRPTSTASPSPTGDTTPSPDEDDAVTRILILTEHVYFGDDAGWAVDGFRYDDPHAQAIAKLTAAFGVAPVSDPVDVGGGQVSEAYRWGGDFLLYFYSGAGEYPTTMAVQVTAPDINGITIETDGGVHVGSPWPDAVAAADSVREGASEIDDQVMEARFDSAPTGQPNEFLALLAFGNAGGAGPVDTLTGPIRIGELPG